jgi:hypothetical protein
MIVDRLPLDLDEKLPTILIDYSGKSKKSI